MASYIISLDKTAYASEDLARQAVTDAGALVEKVFSLPYTYRVDATQEQIDAISGLLHAEPADSMLAASHAEFNTQHLIATAPAAEYNPQYNGAGAVMYLIDTGVNSAHNEFTGSTIENLYKSDDLVDFDDTDGHGTAMASMMVGQNIGTAPAATLKSVKIFGESNGTITVDAIIESLQAILDDHSATSATTKVVCMPWSVTKNQLIDQKLGQLQDENLVLVAAAGNDGEDVDNFTPGGLDTILTVGAFDSGTMQVSAFTNLPKIPYVDDTATPVTKERVNIGKVDMFAAGVNITAASASNVADYVNMSGTSLSASITAGVVAQFIQEHATADAQTIQSYMVASAFNNATSIAKQLGYDNISAPINGEIVDFVSVNYGVTATSQVGSVRLTGYAPGKLLNVQLGQTASLDMNFSASASNFGVLDFSPLSPWMTLDLATGQFSVDTSDSSTAPAAPALYNFALRGEINGEVFVEEFTVGVYETEESELYTASEFYYDSDSNAYDEVITYEAATKSLN